MHYNINILDGTLRIFGACIFGAICGWQGWWIGVLAVYPIVTSLGGWDPIYDLFGFSTRKDFGDSPEDEKHGDIVKLQDSDQKHAA
jgi:hypothetical protein